MLKRIPEDTRRKLTAKGHIPQYGYILQSIPVPPNCLHVPDISDGKSSMCNVRLILCRLLFFIFIWFCSYV